MAIAADQNLNPDVEAFLQGFSNIQGSMVHLTIPEKRQKIREMFVVPKDQLEPIEHVEDKLIHGRHGSIPLRILTPNSSKEDTIIVFFHRGGWVYGSNDESEALCRKIANHTQHTVVQVEYRLAPEHKFPVPLEDCYDAIDWVSKNLKKRLVIIGESVGGTLAAAVCMLARRMQRPKIAAQVLIYPILTSDLIEERYENSPDKHLLSYGNMQWFWQQYLADPREGAKEFASPLKAERFTDLPRTLVMTAEFDALCLEGREFADKLQKAGNDVIYKEYPKVIHGFLDIPIVSPEIENSLNDLKAFLCKK